LSGEYFCPVFYAVLCCFMPFYAKIYISLFFLGLFYAVLCMFYAVLCHFKLFYATKK
jgi:hypothetical protein